MARTPWTFKRTWVASDKPDYNDFNKLAYDQGKVGGDINYDGFHLNGAGNVWCTGFLGVGTSVPVGGKAEIAGGPLTLANGSGGVYDTGGSVQFRTSSALPTVAAAIKSFNQFAGETGGEEGHLVFQANYRRGTNNYSGLLPRVAVMSYGGLWLGASELGGAPPSVLGQSGRVGGLFWSSDGNNLFWKRYNGSYVQLA
jgi:hypothetical protein